MMGQALIFGAGKIGDLAYLYYKDRYDIKGYIDNDEKKWGKKKNNLNIYSPDIIIKHKADTVFIVAVSSKVRIDILKQLHTLGIKGTVNFIAESIEEILDLNSEYGEDELIISFISGLGNQMFQYALWKYLSQTRMNVKMDLSYYMFHKERFFELCDIFDNIKKEECNYLFIKKYTNDKKLFYLESNPRVEPYYYDFNTINNMKIGLIKGYHQNYEWASKIREDLLNDFSFNIDKLDSKAYELTEIIGSNDYTSVHIRRGDYLSSGEISTFGGICTLDYYKQAFEYIIKKNPSTKFCFLSNDIKWVKENLPMKDAIYIEKNMFDTYKDWYDMYIMSICKNNIIANSSFSWWGAWLNKNPFKIVVTPKKWMNTSSCKNICPPEWVRI